ncbi:MAG: glycerol-3-phosphate acyltransferase [Candidatus Phytoplasma cynodontis]|uniref:glycerol-3-phosphate 1-O-acyltransferase PlsY n=1 Tax='Cynodon dactylon' phytoplasma TaxID=295320 RepID=UPI001265AD19|nr:glycerol-3-phosphate 1-O-acyltransferase PlsY ['Cynodon dactylon' phytoplasma]KAB8121754.1 glycerol-3-phosphate 1-O-acyltransferase PlsY ['Cynodon dactylon' phytoplasma]WIA07751.1 MAG: glycerol-3-phosphate acyltransferase [Candidatus Phytoplasma cynodontis]
MLGILLKLNQLNFFWFFIMILFFCYLIGSIPTGLIIGKFFKKKDLRLLGSKNIGASNAARVLGFKYGLLIFILDFLKGFLSIFIGFFLMQIVCYYKNISFFLIDKTEIRIYFGFFVMLGQMFSIFNNFQGGKAIATSVGVVFYINPFIGFFGILSFIIFLRIFGYAFLASLISTLLVDFFLCICFYFNFLSFFPIYKKEILIIFFITILIFVKHFSNIVNWLKSKENKFVFNAKKNKNL